MSGPQKALKQRRPKNARLRHSRSAPLIGYMRVSKADGSQVLDLQRDLGSPSKKAKTNDQVDRCYLCLESRDVCTGLASCATSSARRRDHASPSRLWRRYAHGQWCLQDDCHPPPGSQVSGVGCRARLPQVGLRRYRPGVSLQSPVSPSGGDVLGHAVHCGVTNTLGGWSALVPAPVTPYGASSTLAS